MRGRPLLCLVLLPIALTGCSGQDAKTSGAPTSSPSDQAVPTATVAVVPDAATLVRRLGSHVPTLVPSVVYNATTDPNRLLGRPGGYTSKATWADRRVKPGDAQVNAPVRLILAVASRSTPSLRTRLLVPRTSTGPRWDRVASPTSTSTWMAEWFCASPPT